MDPMKWMTAKEIIIVSLTSHLRNTKSPISEFMRQRFENTGKMVKSANQDAAKLEIVSPPEGIESWRLGTIGSAIDYRIRFNYPEMDVKQTVAATGARLSHSDDLRNGIVNDVFFDLLTEAAEFQAKKRPDLAELEPNDEDKLCRYCYNMAMLEVRFRIRELHKDLQWEFRDVDDLIRKPPQSFIDDIKAQNGRFRTAMSDFLNMPAVLNPTFSGSRDVGGADADLIIDGCLIELKSSRKNLDSDDLRQVLGYCLLDYDGTHRISSLAIYRTRHGITHHWTISDFLVRAMQFPKSLPDLRNEFRELVERSRTFHTSIRAQ